MQIKKAPVKDLVSPEWNPRQITTEELEKLKTSLEEFGYIEPIIVNDVNNHVVGGNQRLRALIALGYDEVDCVYVHIEDINKEKACNVALNKISGDWDEDKLRVVLEDIELSPIDIKLTGFDELELTELEVKEPITVHEDDFIIEDEEDMEVNVMEGDLFKLGNHFLLCGDSTVEANVKKLMQGAKADISFTSPPYNAGFGANLTKDNGRSKYLNDDDNKSADEYLEFLNSYLSNVSKYAQYNFCNIQYLSNNKEPLINFIHDNLQSLADIIIWDKGHSQPAAAENVLNSEYEFVLCFSEKGNRAIGTNQFHGTLKNIVHISNVRTKEYSDIHNATFPMEFAEHFVKNFSTYSVLDVFGGTGTTMIVCEQLHKQCYMMELDPYYCQVIINRWEEYTGRKAEKLPL